MVISYDHKECQILFAATMCVSLGRTLRPPPHPPGEVSGVWIWILAKQDFAFPYLMGDLFAMEPWDIYCLKFLEF